jgi:outer membrane receptor protein involved in Fe transport
VQLNGSVFYYDYTDKQIGGTFIDPIYGALNKLVTVPKSRVVGFELSSDWRPIAGLTISPAITYVNSEIQGQFSNLTPAGVSESFVGESFPYAPKWQGSVNAQYKWGISSRLNAFVATNVSYEDKTNAAFGNLPAYDVKAYTLVDMQAGLESKSGDYRLTIWGRNIFDEYYWTSAQRGFDFDTRYAGMPSTFGVTLSYRYR